MLDRCNLSTIHEALLQAISAGHEQIAETILKHPKYCHIKKENKRFGATDYFYTTTSEDSPFSSDITPLILAAERNQFEIVQLLLLRGETIPKPHHYYCNCQECANKLEFDQLRLAKTRLNAYKGLASGAYISLSSKDPVLTAFELARELRQVAKVEKYYKVRYRCKNMTKGRGIPRVNVRCEDIFISCFCFMFNINKTADVLNPSLSRRTTWRWLTS